MKKNLFFLSLLVAVCPTLLTAQESQPAEQKLTATSKYDFIPGESLMFYDDFSQENVGDFPALWNTNGSGEVVTTNLFGGKWLKLGANASFIPGTKKIFPDNFTIEFDLLAIPGPSEENYLSLVYCIYAAENPNDFNEGGAIPGVGGIKFTFGTDQHSYSTYSSEGYTLNGYSEKQPLAINKKTRLSFWIQKTRLRAYVNEEKIFDVAKALAPGLAYNSIRFKTGSDEASALISNFRVAVGAPDMRNKLITEGKLVTYGIYFDSGSDKIKPESAGTMKEIATVLKENPTVNIKIVGHTDSDGDDAKNLDLSKRRALSVKNALSTEYGIEALRIETDGKGETVPIAPNSTGEGKAKNRRVELIKL
jgi:OOP family OmpA-OmpF porin